LKEHEGIKTVAKQLYTNTSLAYHMLDDQGKARASASFVLEHLDADNFKALMRRAFANRSFFNFSEALKDLKQLKKVMNQDDAALKEVEKMYKSCWRGICQENEAIPEPSTRRMMRPTASWINEFRGQPDSTSRINFLKQSDRNKLGEIFKHIPVPKDIYASIVETMDEKCFSLEDLSWVQ